MTLCCIYLFGTMHSLHMINVTFMIWSVSMPSVLALTRVKRGWLSGGGKLTNIKCAFNPCLVSGFCGDGRSCEIDDRCIHHCICDKDSKHDSCVGATDSSTTKKTIGCTFNPCMSPAFACTGGRTCVLGEFCIPECKCNEDSTHQTCTEGAETSSQRATTAETITDVCMEKCEIGDRCQYISETVQICISATVDANNNLGKISTQMFNVCSSVYVERNGQEQKCSSGESCRFGICRSDSNGKIFCSCDVGATGLYCQTKCCRDCGAHAECVYEEGVGETCKCRHNITEANCTYFESKPLEATYKDPEKVTWYFWLAGACVFVLLILIVLIVVIPYILWRHREIFVMRVVHYFQKYEDEDDRQWDAFVSYKSNTADEEFVVNKLCVKLERELGFKLNIHFRDFLPGETIANNIISAVQGSRRTILIISPKYVTSEFTKLEYQVAQQEMLKRKHRIIPILLEDISEVKDTMDPNLKVILNSVTYIEWPMDGIEKKVNKFWKRMELSLPKKKKRFYDTDCKMSFGNIDGSLKPSSIDIAVVDLEKTKDIYVNKNVYTSKDESKLAVDEVYDTLNENEMDGTCICKSNQDTNCSQNSYLHVLKVQV